MSFHKYQGDELFTGTEMLSREHVLICNVDGKVEAIVDVNDAGDDVEKLQGIVSPGFANCHCHLELSHMRGLIPEKTGLIDFVFAVVTQRHFPDEEILQAIEKAEDEMLACGIVAVGDICNNLLTLAQKQKQRLHYYNFVEASGWLPGIAEQRFLRSKQYYEAFLKVAPTAMVPHAPYSVSNELWKLIAPFYRNKVASIHNQETSFEDELFLKNSGDFVRMYEMMKIDHSFYKPSGKTSLQTYFNRLADAQQVLLVHNTFTKEEDIAFLKKSAEQNVSFCLCVNANQYIESSLPPVELLRKYDCNIVLGTDSLASNWSLSIVDEMKTIQKKFPAIGLTEMLKWATLNGAKALQMDEELGSFEKGKKPGVVLIKDADNGRINERSSATRIL
jgi:aminodeoxyfutalosine deaminase